MNLKKLLGIDSKHIGAGVDVLKSAGSLPSNLPRQLATLEGASDFRNEMEAIISNPWDHRASEVARARLKRALADNVIIRLRTVDQIKSAERRLDEDGRVFTERVDAAAAAVQAAERAMRSTSADMESVRARVASLEKQRTDELAVIDGEIEAATHNLEAAVNSADASGEEQASRALAAATRSKHAALADDTALAVHIGTLRALLASRAAANDRACEALKQAEHDAAAARLRLAMLKCDAHLSMYGDIFFDALRCAAEARRCGVTEIPRFLGVAFVFDAHRVWFAPAGSGPAEVPMAGRLEQLRVAIEESNGVDMSALSTAT